MRPRFLDRRRLDYLEISTKACLKIIVILVIIMAINRIFYK